MPIHTPCALKPLRSARINRRLVAPESRWQSLQWHAVIDSGGASS